MYGPEQRGEFEIGDSWHLQEAGIHVKAYPCCYFTHTAIAATQALVADGVDPMEIEHVLVQASPGARDALHHAEPETTGNKLVRSVPELERHATRSVESTAQRPSFDIDFETMVAAVEGAGAATQDGADDTRDVVSEK